MSWIDADLSDLVARRDVGGILRVIQSPVYNLAVRMLGDPDDVADAAQEILLRVATHLDQFRDQASFSTWVYRVAANHLLTARARRAEAKTEHGSFAEAADQLAGALEMSRSSPRRIASSSRRSSCGAEIPRPATVNGAPAAPA